MEDEEHADSKNSGSTPSFTLSVARGNGDEEEQECVSAGRRNSN